MRDRFAPHYRREIDAPAPMDDRPRVPGRVIPPNPGEDRPGGSPFGRLAKGCALGKSSQLLYDASATGTQDAGVDMLVVEGDDLDASQLLVTLAPPRVIPIAFLDLPIDLQNVSGELTNLDIGAETFPGTSGPVAWPPLEAHVTWGVKGAQAEAVLDYVNGVTFSVVASYLRVTALVTATEALNGIVGTSALYNLKAFVGPGYARDNARRTIYVGTLNDGAESSVFVVPKLARRAFLFGATAAATPLVSAGYIRFWQSADGVAGVNNVGNFFGNGNQPVSVDVPNGAMYFSVFNQSGAQMKMGVIFELALT